MASKASEWAEKVKDADNALYTAKNERPDSYTLTVAVGVNFAFSVDEKGTPRLVTPQAGIGYEVDAALLLELGVWILDTFGEAQP